MSWKILVCAAIAGAVSIPAVAQPSLDIIDNADGTATVQITTDAVGSVAVELAITSTAGFLTDAVIADSLFDTVNPGNNPFTGETTNGIYDDLATTGNLFVSYGSDVLDPVGTYDFLTLSYSGADDITVTADSLIAQLGTNNGLSEATFSLDDTGGGFLEGDANLDGVVGADDITSVLSNFGSTNPPPGDANGDGVVGADDITSVLANFGNVASSSSSATAVPEPAAALMAIGMIGLAAARRR